MSKPVAPPFRIGAVGPQIRANAGFYTPDLYAQALSFWGISFPPGINTYIPLSPIADRTKDQAMIFGLLPPTGTVTGRMLDRSATVAATPPQPGLRNPNPVDQLSGPLPKAQPQLDGTGSIDPAKSPNSDPSTRNSSQGKTPSVAKVDAGYTTEAAAAMTAAFTKVHGRPPTNNELVVLLAQTNLESGWGKSSYEVWPDGESRTKMNESEWKATYSGKVPRQKINNWGAMHGGKGPTAFVGCDHNALAQPPYAYKTTFSCYPTPEAGAEAFVRLVTQNANYSNAMPALSAGDCMAYAEAIGPIIDPVTGKIVPFGRGGKLAYFEMSPQGYGSRMLARVPSIVENLGITFPDNTGGPNSWTNGAVDAQNAAQQNSKVLGTSQNLALLDTKLMRAQNAASNQLRIAIDKVRDTPPLAMMVNPAEFNVTYNPLIAEGNSSRTQTIVEHWGENQSTIAASGKVAGFFAADAFNGNGPGLSRVARSVSAGYNNFLSLYMIYRNNGGIYLEDSGFSGAARKNLSVVGGVYLYYNNTLYIGSFNSFTCSESDGAPFTLEYNFEFSVRAAFPLDNPMPPELNLGTKSTPTGSKAAATPVSPPSTSGRQFAATEAVVSPDKTTAPVPRNPNPENGNI